MDRKILYTAPPKAAWKKELGDVDWDKTYDTLGNMSGICGDKNQSKADRTTVGIPLGGFGAGNFEYNITGTFGPWQMEPSILERRYLATAAFHAREEIVDTVSGDTISKKAATLAATGKLEGSANHLHPSWERHLLDIGSADYYALYPKGWVDYKDNFKTDLKLEFFSPIIADNYKETSLPEAFFVFHAVNRTENRTKISVMFTFPNAPAFTAENENAYVTAIIGASGQKKEGTKTVVRHGLKNRSCATGTTESVVMSCDSPNNDMKVQNTEYCIAVTKNARYSITKAVSWDANSDCDALWSVFDNTGNVSNFDRCCEEPAGALCVKAELEPGEEIDIPFALTWNFPVTESGSKGARDYQAWWKKYTEFYPPCNLPKDQWTTDSFQPQAMRMADDGLNNLDEICRSMSQWMDRYLDNPNYKGKEWILSAGFNELYYNAFGGSFWENGLIISECYTHNGNKICTNQKLFGNRDFETDIRYADMVDNYKQKHQCLHYTVEAQEFPFAETFDVRGHSHRVYTDLWPEIERDILLLYKDFIMDTKGHSCPHDAGNPAGAVFVLYDYYFKLMEVMNADAYPEGFSKRTTTPWSEFSPKFILYCYEYWKKTNDSAFICDVWEAIVASYIYERKTDTDNDGVTNMKSSEYDRNELFNSVLCVGAMEAIQELCKAYPDFGETKVKYVVSDENGNVLEDVDNLLIADVTKELEKTRSYIENKLWNPEECYYQFNSEAPIIMADAFIGERHIRNAGLPGSVDPDRLAKHFEATYQHNVCKCYGKNHDGTGHCGAKNLVNLDSERSYKTADGVIEHSADVWTGVSYVLSANMYYTAVLVNDEKLKQYALDTAHGVYYTTYEDTDTAYYFNTPEAWNAMNPRFSRNRMYQRARGAWELLRVVAENE